MSLTSIHFDIIDDVSEPNEYLKPIDRMDMKLAAAIWIAPGINDLPEKRAALLQHVLQKLSYLHDRREIWLLAAHRLYQDDNRIARHFGLWKSLKRAELDLPLRAERYEVLHEAKKGLKYFGAVRIEPDDSMIVNELMLRESACISLFDRDYSRSTVKNLLASGWKTDRTDENPPMKILDTVSSADGIVIEAFGRFDDPEVAVAAYGLRQRSTPCGSWEAEQFALATHELTSCESGCAPILSTFPPRPLRSNGRGWPKAG